MWTLEQDSTITDIKANRYCIVTFIIYINIYIIFIILVVVVVVVVVMHQYNDQNQKKYVFKIKLHRNLNN